MTARRSAWAASCLAMCLASPVLADDQLVLPPLPDAADVVITAADLAVTAGAAIVLPPLPEPAPVSLDLAGSPAAAIEMAPSAAPDVAEPARETAAAPNAIVSDPAIVTAAITPAEPVLTGQALPPDIELALPPPPEAAKVVLDDLMPAKPAAELAETSPRIEAGKQPDLSGLVAQALPEALRLGWLPERAAQEIMAAYEARGHKPFWMEGDRVGAAGQRLVQHLARAGDDGLDAADYALPRLILPRPLDLALADIRLTAFAVRYARDARGARVDLRKVSALITPQLDLPGAGEVLARLSAEGADPEAVLAGYQPQHEGYQALRSKLAEVRLQRKAVDSSRAPRVRIPHGPAIRIGMRDDRIVLVRARFGFAPDETRMHDRALATVVAGFQRENGLPDNGVLNRATVDAMNGGAVSSLEADLIANMERWRWLPADLGAEHLIVNVPEYVVRKVEAGRVVHSARVIVGKTERPTPIFSDMMDHLVMNPSWTIPPTIMREDILPKLATDPGYAERRGFQVIRRGNQITVRQPPGPTNALGDVKFMFPNSHAVYLHDTPSRGLFASSRRAYSSGCVRVEKPLKLAELVLGGQENGWSERRLQAMVGSGERTIRLTRKLPIHIVYMTHVVDSGGALRSYDDIYGFHRRTRAALGL